MNKDDARRIECRFAVKCDRRWDDLQPTQHDGIRFCVGCQHEVHRVDSLDEVEQHRALGHCINIPLEHDPAYLKAREDALTQWRNEVPRLDPPQLTGIMAPPEPEPRSGGLFGFFARLFGRH